MSGETFHEPILVKEVLHYLRVYPSNIYIDATIGAGGHSGEIASQLKNQGKILAFDIDSEILEIAKKKLKKYGNIQYYNLHYKEIPDIVREENLEQKIDGIIFDLGVNSIHLDTAERGFSFSKEAGLDMRFNRKRGLTAKDIVNKYSKFEIEHILRLYGEEKFAGRIAKKITLQRKKSSIRTTTELKKIVMSCYPAGIRRKSRIHPATRTFQALRIAVNSELEGLDKTIINTAKILTPGGRLVVISFHSLEDRIIKQTFRLLSSEENYKILTKKPVRPEKMEIIKNKRSRSARLRVIERN